MTATPDTTPARRRDRARAFFWRPIGLKDLMIMILGAIAALGFTVSTPGKKLGALDTRVTRNERRLDSLAEEQRFDSYMLCVLVRRIDPPSVPPGCAPTLNAPVPPPRSHR